MAIVFLCETCNHYIFDCLVSFTNTKPYATYERLPEPRHFVFNFVFPFAISFAYLSRYRAGFFFRGIHVSEINFRELSRKILLASKHILYWNFCSPPPPPPPRSPLHHQCQPRAPNLSGHCQTSTASARFQSPTATARSGHCRTSTASTRSQWAMPRRPDLSGHSQTCERQISVGTAVFWGWGHPSYRGISRSFREDFTDFRACQSCCRMDPEASEETVYKHTQTLKVSFRELSREQIFAKAFANVVLAFTEPSYFNSPLNLNMEVLVADHLEDMEIWKTIDQDPGVSDHHQKRTSHVQASLMLWLLLPLGFSAEVLLWQLASNTALGSLLGANGSECSALQC